MKFLEQPRPQRISHMDLENTGKKQPMLSIGLTERKYTEGGLAIVPCLEVLFAIGETRSDPDKEFSVPINMARELAASITAFCDYAETDGKTT